MAIKRSIERLEEVMSASTPTETLEEEKFGSGDGSKEELVFGSDIYSVRTMARHLDDAAVAAKVHLDNSIKDLVSPGGKDWYDKNIPLLRGIITISHAVQSLGYGFENFNFKEAKAASSALEKARKAIADFHGAVAKAHLENVKDAKTKAKGHP